MAHVDHFHANFSLTLIGLSSVVVCKLTLSPSQNNCPTSHICFVPKWFVGLFARLETQGSKSHIFASDFHHQEVCRLRSFGGRFGMLFLFEESNFYNYSVNSQRTLISPKLRTRTIILGRSEGAPSTLLPIVMNISIIAYSIRGKSGGMLKKHAPLKFLKFIPHESH